MIIALIGLPGSGKSAVAPLLAARLGCPWADLDERIARAEGVPVPELLRRRGEAAFRSAEEAALREALQAAGAAPGEGAGAAPRESRAGPRPALVLACGGGVVTRDASRSLLRGHAFVLWLRVSPGAAAARLGAARSGEAERPLLEGPGSLPERIESLLARRDTLYRAAAHASVETDGRAPDEVAAEAERAVRGRTQPWDSSGS